MKQTNDDHCSPSHKKELITTLFLTYRNYIKGVALRYVVFPHLADEVVQQVYVEFLAGADGWDLEGNIKMLLGVMTRNRAKTLWKSESRHSIINLQEIANHICLIAEQDGWEEHYSEDLEALEKCLKKVSKKTRELIQLHYFEGVPFKTIAAQMDRNSDTVYRAVYRIKEKLLECIKRVLQGGEAYV